MPFCACVARRCSAHSFQSVRSVPPFIYFSVHCRVSLRVKPRPYVAAKHDKQCEKEVDGLCCLACGAESCQLKASVQQSREYGILLDFGLCQNPPKFRMLTPLTDSSTRVH